MKEMTFFKVDFDRIKFNFTDYRYLSHFAFLVASIYLIYVLFTPIYKVNSTSQFQSLLPESEPISQDNIKSTQMDFLNIKNWHLFGYTTVSIEENNQLNEEPQKTDLQIKLLGVFFLPNQKTASYAIIEGDDKQQKKYRAGDEMPNSIILQSIAKDQVILLRNQQAEYLSMDRTKLSDYN
jgi:general secretion pathway protein C